MSLKGKKEFSDRSFRQKVKKFGVKAGRKVTEPAVAMYHCMKDKDTPLRARLIIAGALAYFIVPSDMICDLSPLVGFTDDLTTLLAAYEMIRKYVKPEHTHKAKEQVTMIIK
ncbi:MAG: YkvA family protein [Bacteroidales bacterium]|jgi:uncharacterized membrane protein YkvA (DUF1232 family)